jgi:hypothetical protein
MKHILIVAAVIAAIGCAKGGAKQAVAPASSQTIIVASTENGREVRAEPGAKVEVHAPKGTAWTLESGTDSGLRFVGKSTKGGEEVFSFTVPSSGVYNVRLKRDKDTFECTIVATLKL